MEKECETCGVMMHARSTRCVECGSFCGTPKPPAPVPTAKRVPLKLAAAPLEEDLAPPAEAAPPSPRSRQKASQSVLPVPPPPVKGPGSPRATAAVVPALPAVPSRQNKPVLAESADAIVMSLKASFKSSEEPHRVAPPLPAASGKPMPPPPAVAVKKEASKVPPPVSRKSRMDAAPSGPLAPAVVVSAPPPQPPPAPSSASRRRATSLDRPEATSKPEVNRMLVPPPVPDANRRRVSGESSPQGARRAQPPQVPDANKRRTKEQVRLADSGGAAVVPPLQKKTASGSGTFPEDCRSALQDPYWRTQLQAFAAEQGKGPMVVFWALVDEFKQALNPKVRCALAERIHIDFVREGALNGRVLDDAAREREQLARDYEELGVLLPPLTFYDFMQGTVEIGIEEKIYPAWRASSALKQAQQRPGRAGGGVIGAPVLSVQPKTRFALVPIEDAQSAAGVGSQADDEPPSANYGRAHRRSVSLGTSTPSLANLAPSPFAKKKVNSPPPERPQKQSSPPPPRPQQGAAALHAAHHHGIDNVVGGEEWSAESILSESCTFDWELLNAFNTEPKLEVIKCLVVGDLGVGKTVLCKTMLGDEFASGYVPTVFETYKIKVPLYREVPVELWDMSGNAKYDKKRPVVYPNVNALLICFDLTSKESWQNVKRKWVPEAMSYPTCPLLIAGCKFDRINASNAQMCVQPAQVNSFLDKRCRGVFKSAHFVSTSAAKAIGLERLFAGIVYCTLYAKKRPDEINSSIARIKHLDFNGK